MIRPALLAGAIIAIPSLVTAQGVEFNGTTTLGASFNSISGIPGTSIDLNGYSLDFDGDLVFSENFSVGIGFGASTGNLSVTGGANDINIDLLSLSVEPTYAFGNGGYVGVYYRMGDLDIALAGPVTIGIDTSQYGIFGGYDFGQGHVEAFYGVSELNDNSIIPIALNVDVTDYGLSGSYMPMPELEIFGSVLRSDIDTVAGTVNATAYAIGAQYDIGNGIDIYGSVGGSTFDLSALGAPSDISAVGLTIGASYDLTQAASMPLILSAEYSRTNLDLGAIAPGIDPEIDRFAIGLTIPIGNGSGNALNSNTRMARGDYRSAVAAVFNAF